MMYHAFVTMAFLQFTTISAYILLPPNSSCSNSSIWQVVFSSVENSNGTISTFSSSNTTDACKTSCQDTWSPVCYAVDVSYHTLGVQCFMYTSLITVDDWLASYYNAQESRVHYRRHFHCTGNLLFHN